MTKFMLTISAILVLGTIMMMAWVDYSSYQNTLHQALYGVSNLSDSVHDAVYGFMSAGKQESLDAFLEKSRQFNTVREVRVIRSAELENELGIKPGTRVQDELDRQVLATGKEINREVLIGRDRGVRRVIPIITDKSCLDCHAGAKEGSVLAALSITISYQAVIDEMLHNLFSTGLIQLGVIVLVIVAVFFLFNSLIMVPLVHIADCVRRLGTSGDLSAGIEVRSGAGKRLGDLASAHRECEGLINSHDEIGELASAFNTMSQDLRRTTVSRDELLKEVEERKRAEHELKEAYARLKSAQAQLIQSEKMALMGQLSAGVAHEINSPTAFVTSNLETLQQYLNNLTRVIEQYQQAADKLGVLPLAAGAPDQELAYILSDSPKLVQESLDGMERIRKIVHDLKHFAHAGAKDKDLARLEDILQSSINIVWNEIKYKVQIIRNYGQLPPVLCYPQQLSQVFINLLVNAAQAIERNGTITIKGYVQGSDVVLEFTDNGSGMPREVMDHLFEPFFTTKSVGKGLGLGLSLASDIIQQHQGEITVRSKVGEGSTFTVRLPIARQEDTPPAV